MGPVRYAQLVFAALVVMFIAANVLAGAWFAGARLDLTENRLYSLSQGTKETLARLNEPVSLTFYYSRDAAADDPTVRAYGARVREMLQSYRRASRGRVRVVEVQPQRFAESEDKAVAAGVEPLVLRAGAEPIFIGVVGQNAVDETVTMPQLTPDREPFLEYELTRLISELQDPTKPKVALVSALPWDPAAPGFGGPAPATLEELARFADVEKLPVDFSEVGDNIDILAILHPWPLSERQLYAIDQFVMRKGRAFIAVDPAAILLGQGAVDPTGLTPGVPQSSELDRLLTAWGVTVSTEAVLDRENALPIQAAGPDGRAVVMPQPLFVTVPSDQIDREDLVTTGLSRGLNVAAPGGITVTETAGVATTALAHTSGDTMRIPGASAIARPEPLMLLQQFTPARKQETVAVRIVGKLPSAFGPARPAGVSARADVPHVAKAETDATVFLVSDADFLDNALFVGPGGQPVADNAAFLLNAIDQLGGSTALLSLRSRAPSLRRMEVVDAIRNRAQAEIAQTQQAMQEELVRTESKLRDLETKGRGSGYFSGALGNELTGEERAEIERFKARILAIRAELRGMERGYRTELAGLKGWLMALNVWLAPLLVAAGGAWFVLRRRARIAKEAEEAMRLVDQETAPPTRAADASSEEAA